MQNIELLKRYITLKASRIIIQQIQTTMYTRTLKIALKQFH